MKTNDKLLRLRAMLFLLDLDNNELAKVSGVSKPNLSSLLTGKIDHTTVRSGTWDKIITALVQIIQTEPERFLPIE